MTEINDCGHNDAHRGQCHTSTRLPCIHHFVQLFAEASQEACRVNGSVREFSRLLKHLNNDGYLFAAWYTWMALVGEYAVPAGMDPLVMLDEAPTPPDLPADAPPFVRAALPLANYALRAALLRDGDNIEATFAAAGETLDPNALLSFLVSGATSAHHAMEHRDDCTVQDMHTYATLGSQVKCGHGAVALPYLVDLVRVQHAFGFTTGPTPATEDAYGRAARALFSQIEEVQIAAVQVVAQALRQTSVDEVMLQMVEGMPRTPEAWHSGENLLGLIDVDRATPDTCSPGAMAAVWALRAARAYSTPSGEGDSYIARLRTLAEQHGDADGFVTDVITAGTHMIANSMAVDALEHPPTPPAG